MGNGYNHYIHHKSTTFLPMLCSKPSIKNAVAPPPWDDRSDAISDDPLSPKVGCMGQVKRNSKVVVYPTSSHHKLTISNNVKYSKLKRLFSAKNLTTTTTTAATTTSAVSATAARRCRSRRRQVMLSGSGENCGSVNIVDMDPPLPVIRKVKNGDGGEGENLWKRRSGGFALKSLQVQQIQNSGFHLEPTTV